MQLKLTTRALDELEKLNEDGKYSLLLWYDTEGFGCGVNGMPTVVLTNEIEEDHKEIDSNYSRTLIDVQQAIFFAENMKLDFIEGMFRLSSPEGILNPFISSQRLVAKR